MEKAADRPKLESIDYAFPLNSCFSPCHRVSLISAAAYMAVTAPRISATLIDVANTLPGPSEFTNDESFVNSPYNVELGWDFLNSEPGIFSAFLNRLFPNASNAEKELFDMPFVEGSMLLCVASTLERAIDYSMVSFCVSGELEGTKSFSNELYSREKSNIHVSLAAQRILDIILNSKLIKKNSTKDLLAGLPQIFGPLYLIMAQVRTSIAKYQSFFTDSNVSNLLSGFIDGCDRIFAKFNNCKIDSNGRWHDENGKFCTSNDKVGISTQRSQENKIVNEIGSLPARLMKSVFDHMKKSITEIAKREEKGHKLQIGMVGRMTFDLLVKESVKGFYQFPYFSVPSQVVPKEPVGTRDLLPQQMKIREQVIGLITSIFKRHGAVTIDTPVFELREVLTEKYGEESKLIYNLEDQGGELLSLRYDLTVPFARFVATHGINSIKRYHIAKVYRRDKPAIERGRFREFYQCDFDIAGVSSPMIADAEVISVICELLDSIGKFCKMPDFSFEIKVSHRQLLSAMTEIAGVPTEKFRTVCSSIDKLDKVEWSIVRNELIEMKGLSAQAADKLHEFLVFQGEPKQVLSELRKREDMLSVAGKILDEMELLFSYLEALDVLKFIKFDLSLARGLDYYTGVIYEGAATNSKIGVGSIAGGGRYDGLIGMFANKPIPAVGVSLGIERVFAIIENNMPEKPRQSDTEVFIASIFADYTKERMEIAGELWRNGIPCEMMPKNKPDIKTQFGLASSIGARLTVILAPDEMTNGQIKIKNMTTSEEIIIARSNLIPEIKKLLQ